MKAIIDTKGCIGCGLCASACPEVFGMTEEGPAQVLADPTANTIDAAKKAEKGCPVTVITIE